MASSAVPVANAAVAYSTTLFASEEPLSPLLVASSALRIPGTSTKLNVFISHKRYFRDLASPEASVKEAAATSLVTRLQEIQKRYKILADKESGDRGLMLESETNDGLDNSAPHLRNSLRRLIRGVPSSIECARQEFALGLTLPVSLISSINVKSLLKLISDSLSVSSSMKGQDVKECSLGRLFAYGALARSED